MQLEFFMPMIPPTTTHQMHKVRVVKGKPIFYEPPEVKDARAKLLAHLAEHRPEREMKGAVELSVMWLFPPGESNHKDGEYRTTKPDTDNLEKLLKDCMTAVGFWRDDAQVAVELIAKRWAVNCGIWINVREIEEE